MFQTSTVNSPLAIAPMIDWTYSYFRVLMRIMAPHALLYTEMQTPGAVFNNPQRALYFDPIESPVALQLGSSDIDALVRCAQIAEERGFAEINLNLGCPSDRVQAGRFGACLMSEPTHVANCIAAIKHAVSIPVTAKTRIGIDNQDSYDFFSSFIKQLVCSGCDKVIVHARKAWLHGLNPKQNRSIPPLHYDYVYRIKTQWPDIPFVINGNVNSLDEIREHLQHVDGVMLGRLACQNPYAIALIDHGLNSDKQLLSRSEVIRDYISHILSTISENIPMSLVIKPILNFTHGMPGARLWKKRLLEIQRTGDYTSLNEIISLLDDIDGV